MSCTVTSLIKEPGSASQYVCSPIWRSESLQEARSMRSLGLRSFKRSDGDKSWRKRRASRDEYGRQGFESFWETSSGLIEKIKYWKFDFCHVLCKKTPHHSWCHWNFAFHSVFIEGREMKMGRSITAVIRCTDLQSDTLLVETSEEQASIW